MHIIKPPHLSPVIPADLFLAGGISNCPDWQTEATVLLGPISGITFNPRRSTEFTSDMASEQIQWEHQALRNSKAILFWFPEETLCPITLFELGVFSQKLNVPIFVGTHPNYQRKFDVFEQLRLERPEVTVFDTIESVVSEFASWFAAQ